MTKAMKKNLILMIVGLALIMLSYLGAVQASNIESTNGICFWWIMESCFCGLAGVAVIIVCIARVIDSKN